MISICRIQALGNGSEDDSSLDANARQLSGLRLKRICRYLGKVKQVKQVGTLQRIIIMILGR